MIDERGRKRERGSVDTDERYSNGVRGRRWCEGLSRGYRRFEDHLKARKGATNQGMEVTARSRVGR